MIWMNRSQELNNLWSYLPAFRAVAETEHLPTAAAQLHVVPSALSRSVKLLEQAVGSELFVRRGRRLVLSARGRLLLAAVQQGALALERGVAAARGGPFEGELRIGTIGVLTNHVVLPVLLELAREQPELVPSMQNCRPTEANHRLALGGLDLAFYYDAVPLEGIWCGRLGALSASIYCGREHPLYKARKLSERLLSEHPFSAPQLGDRNVPMDGWPVHLERKVGFRIELLYSNLEVALSGRYLTVLPDIAARPYLGRKRLRRLPFDLIPDIEVFGACREGGEEGAPIQDILRRVEARLSPR